LNSYTLGIRELPRTWRCWCSSARPRDHATPASIRRRCR